jgi:hypothetical protein
MVTVEAYTTHEVIVMLLKDDIATLKGTVNGVVNSELSMLNDALSALKADKAHVTEDHIERVIYALNGLLKKVNA